MSECVAFLYKMGRKGGVFCVKEAMRSTVCTVYVVQRIKVVFRRCLNHGATVSVLVVAGTLVQVNRFKGCLLP